MSDHDAAPDPIDKAYVQAEALLSDDETRAARRARVLAAVAQEAVTAAATSPPVPRPAWRRGRWLAAASVAGLGVLVASQIYRPPPYLPQTAPAPPTSAARPTVASSASPAAALSAAPRTVAVTPPTFTPVQPIAPPPFPPVRTYDPAPALPPQAFPETLAPPPPPPPPAPESVVVTAERRENDVTGAAQKAAPLAAAAPAAGFESSAGHPSDQAARLRAAAAGGRTADVETLLDQGVPVDAPDAEGNTALMKSILADQPATAALLRRHGASLDHRNHAGDSARDMATAKGDAALNQALGTAP